MHHTLILITALLLAPLGLLPNSSTAEPQTPYAWPFTTENGLFHLWLPQDAPAIKGLLVFPYHGTGEQWSESPEVQDLAKELSCGIVAFDQLGKLPDRVFAWIAFKSAFGKQFSEPAIYPIPGLVLSGENGIGERFEFDGSNPRPVKDKLFRLRLSEPADRDFHGRAALPGTRIRAFDEVAERARGYGIGSEAEDRACERDDGREVSHGLAHQPFHEFALDDVDGACAKGKQTAIGVDA